MEAKIKIYRPFRGKVRKNGKRVVSPKLFFIIHLILKQDQNGKFSYKVQNLYRCKTSATPESIFPYIKFHCRGGMKREEWEALKTKIIQENITSIELERAKMEFWRMFNPLNVIEDEKS